MSMNLGSILGGDIPAEAYTEGEFNAIPPGWYEAFIEDASVRQTRAGTGHYVKLRFKLVNEHKNRVLFANINIQNPHPEAERIGRREIAALAHACGMVSVPPDESAFVDKVIEIRVVLSKDRENENEVAGYRPASGGTPAQTPARPAAKPAAAPSTTTATPATQGAMPWMKS